MNSNLMRHVIRSNLHNRACQEGMKTTRVPCMIGGGVQWLTAVPAHYGDRLTRQYREARANARMMPGPAQERNQQ